MNIAEIYLDYLAVKNSSIKFSFANMIFFKKRRILRSVFSQYWLLHGALSPITDVAIEPNSTNILENGWSSSDFEQSLHHRNQT